MKKNAFTLIELIATVAILCIVFLFIGPKLVSIIKENEGKTKEIAESKVIDAAKEYANAYNPEFLDNFTTIGDIENITIRELIDSGLADEEDLDVLGDGTYIEVRLQSDYKLDFTLIYP